MLHINFQTNDSVLEIPFDSLPDDPAPILKVLSKEKAPIRQWLSLAVSILLLVSLTFPLFLVALP